jgi:prepilin-type N-terminal cleavage/methylation domain-containing protein
MRRNAGFSLVEVLCAILILGVALVGLTEGVSVALRSSKDSEVLTSAALLASSRIEMIRADGYIFDGEDEGEGTGPMAAYRWTQSITKTDIDGLHDVTVAVENSTTGQRVYELRTLLFDPPVLSSTDDTNTKDKSKKSDRRNRRRR